MTNEELEYRKYHDPSFSEKAELIRKSIESAKYQSDKRRRIIEAKARKKKRMEYDLTIN